MDQKTKSILLVGVGGQGTILASKLLSNGLMQAGYDVKMSEIHGMSQRGGSVSSHIRYGGQVWSPVIETGSADLLVAFEQMEALRWLDYLKTGGKVVVNDYQIPSIPVTTGKRAYPQGILEELRRVADILARHNGNIIKLEHNQFVNINRQAGVELKVTLEAFGHEHKRQILAALQKEGYNAMEVSTGEVY